MTHYTEDCNWGCEYNLQGFCKRCNQNILSYRDKRIKFIGKRIWNDAYDRRTCPIYRKLEEDYEKGLISVTECINKQRELYYIDVKISEVNPIGSLEELGPWQKDPDANWCWLRTVKGGDPDKLEDRRVFVEKTPRVFDPSLNLDINSWLPWISGDKGDYGEDGFFDEHSRYWANVMAYMLGYKVTFQDGLN